MSRPGPRYRGFGAQGAAVRNYETASIGGLDRGTREADPLVVSQQEPLAGRTATKEAVDATLEQPHGELFHGRYVHLSALGVERCESRCDDPSEPARARMCILWHRSSSVPAGPRSCHWAAHKAQGRARVHDSCATSEPG